MRAGTAQDAANTVASHLGVTTFPLHLESITANYFGIDLEWKNDLEGSGYLLGQWMWLAERIKDNPVERDMTITHELGHFIHIQLGLHKTATKDERENYADTFASYFLHPE